LPRTLLRVRVFQWRGRTLQKEAKKMRMCRLRRIVERSKLHGDVASLERRLPERGKNTNGLTFHIVVGVSIASAAKERNTSTARSKEPTPVMRFHESFWTTASSPKPSETRVHQRRDEPTQPKLR
jgi:hypothetical protein